MDTATAIALGAGILSFLVTLVNIAFTERVRSMHQARIEDLKAEHQESVEVGKAEHQRDLERLKSELGRETEGLRSELSRVAFEHQTRFSRLHERRVDVVAELYLRLVQAESAFNTAMFPLRSGATHDEIEAQQKIDYEAAASAGNSFSEYFQSNRIWLEEDLCRSIQKLARTFRAAWRQHTDPDERLGKATQMHAAWKMVTDDVPKIREEIETTMRVMLGVLNPRSQLPSDRDRVQAPSIDRP